MVNTNLLKNIFFSIKFSKEELPEYVTEDSEFNRKVDSELLSMGLDPKRNGVFAKICKIVGFLPKKINEMFNNSSIKFNQHKEKTQELNFNHKKTIDFARKILDISEEKKEFAFVLKNRFFSNFAIKVPTRFLAIPESLYNIAIKSKLQTDYLIFWYIHHIKNLGVGRNAFFAFSSIVIGVVGFLVIKASIDIIKRVNSEFAFLNDKQLFTEDMVLRIIRFVFFSSATVIGLNIFRKFTVNEVKEQDKFALNALVNFYGAKNINIKEIIDLIKSFEKETVIDQRFFPNRKNLIIQHAKSLGIDVQEEIEHY